MPRSAVLAGLAALIVPLSAPAPTQALDAPVRPGPPAAAQVTRVVRLATGDSVRLATGADGVVTPSMVGRTPFLWTGRPAALYVVPRTSVARRPELDLSLFDTTALAAVTRHGRTPVVVRFAPGASRTRIAGLRLVPGSSRAVGQATQVDASYGPHFTGFTARSLRGISAVRLAAGPPHVSRAPAGVATHTVTVDVKRGNGAPADYALVTLQDTVDGDAYLEQADVDGAGLATFDDVPDGEYSIVVQTFEKVLVNRQLVVTADRTVGFDLGRATVKASATLPGARTLSTTLLVERDPERGFGIPFGLEAPNFSMRVQPTSGKVRHGSLHTGVFATFVTGRAAAGYDRLAVTDDTARGIPAHLTYPHHRRDFARTTDLFYANGPAAKRPLMLFEGNTHLRLGTADAEFSVPVPSRLHVWVEAGRGAYLQQTVFPLATEDLTGDNTQIGDVRAYRQAGPHPAIRFLHGPVGPGLEVPPHGRYTSGAERRGDTLQLAAPVIAGSGGPSFDFADKKDATWSLRQGRRLLAHGHQAIYRSVDVARSPRVFHLSASTHPGRAWDLSTHVRDDWTFHSRAARRAVPLLTPSYLPPTDLAGDLGPGRIGFRLSFHSTPHSARVRHASVELSTDDGRTWRPVRLVRTSGLTFRVSYRNPAAAVGRRYVSLRVRARDLHGNTVEETAIHAYRLR